jgi:hypothetical protein
MKELNRHKFYVQYWNQKIGYCIVNQSLYEVNDEYISCSIDYLKLKSLSKITDEDAIEVAKLGFGNSTIYDLKPKITNYVKRDFGISFKHQDFCGDRQDYMINFSNFYDISLFCLSRATNEKEKIVNVVKIIDFLRSRGYAVPYMDYSVEDLINKGWIKLEE